MTALLRLLRLVLFAVSAVACVAMLATGATGGRVGAWTAVWIVLALGGAGLASLVGRSIDRRRS